ncbi:MAG: glycoside hydrolase family 57 protein, partial [Nanoarchaeota archaeon]
LDLIKKHEGRFRVAYSLSGTAMDQFKKFSPETLDSFKRLVDTGCVEILSETYNHSLAFLYSRAEFHRQVELHRELVRREFGVTPTAFRNTELIYSNEVAAEVERMGYKVILAEGADRVLGWRSPNFVYQPEPCSKLRLLLKNYRLSDDIAFRFSNRGWPEWPLTAEKFAGWVHQVNGNGETVNLFMDYETFGEHQWAPTGIFRFMQHLPKEILKHRDNDFLTPSEAIARYPSVGELDIHPFISWADVERDLTAWLGNRMQQSAIAQAYAMEKDVKAANDAAMLRDWRLLQTSDHFYYMCTKWFADGDVHRYFNPYDTPYDSFITYMNVINDLVVRLRVREQQQSPLAAELLSTSKT